MFLHVLFLFAGIEDFSGLECFCTSVCGHFHIVDFVDYVEHKFKALQVFRLVFLRGIKSGPQVPSLLRVQFLVRVMDGLDQRA